LLPLALVFACGAAQATDASSIFLVADRNPLLQFHNPPPVLGADTAPAGVVASAWTLEVINDAVRQEAPGRELLVLDGELWRLEMNLRYGVRDGFDVGLSVPLLAHAGGIMDGPIWEWHELFGLSNNRRRPFAQDHLQYSYVRGDRVVVDMQDENGGIGDVALTAGWRLWRDEVRGRTVGLQAAIKLPTGDEKRLRGSGTTDLSMVVTGADAAMLREWRTRLVWRAGLVAAGSGGPLDAERRDWAPLAGLGLERPINARLALKAQVDAHGAWYDSDLSAFADHAVQLTVGAGIALARGKLDIAIVEDLVNDPTPDFGLYLAWQGRQ
jgi:hypothetical protein